MNDHGSTTDPEARSPASPRLWRLERPEHFSTYVPRDLVRRLKVIAALRDLPLWSIVTDALRQYLERFEAEHGRLPELASSSDRQPPGRG